MFDLRLLASFFIVASTTAVAAVPQEQIDKLGASLTPVGATKEGNAEGTIPEWNNSNGSESLSDEKPLFKITAENLSQYEDKVSEATKEMIRRFPDSFYLNVYPTHRTMFYPDKFYELTKINALDCTTSDDGLALKGCFGGVPFPFPKSGYEVMWNVTTAPKPPHYKNRTQGVILDSSGTPVQAAIQETWVDSPYHDLSSSLEEYEKNGHRYFRASIKQVAPARIAGDANMITYTSNPTESKNQGWQYQQGNRRVRVNPQAEYDFPTVVSGGAAFYDETGLFMGKMDKFDFTLVGKKEIYIPYNTEMTRNASVADFAASKKHPNPEVVRWELHRVWVVEAKLKPGERHASAKRVYYIDEDYYGAGLMDSWDAAGNFHKLSWAISSMDYAHGWPSGGSQVWIDLTTGVSYINVMTNFAGAGKFPQNEVLPASTWTPEGLSRRSSR
ncbi:DUF1329 domain-containing protein [Halopseudomonas sp. SMJS2]|uniref:DUF1329 domain-containing protein n=1 Tax=Halopseudomonas sp. SMJS2 TaxID=3041098 RepID=UPI002452B1B1|nr:DUF1329 domain-containing protein [Halopseudomonas sp. SMJS2]WGK62469.1 DUF1329 domain-containing protein [Halopseudomonas sp. SMJS2]